MNLAVGYVWSVTSFLAKFIVANQDAEHCDENGDPFVPTWTPALEGIIANGDTVTLDYSIEMLVDTQAGLTVTVADAEATITGVAASGTNVDITLSAAITSGQSVVVDYTATTGNVRSNAVNPTDATSFNDIVASNVTV